MTEKENNFSAVGNKEESSDVMSEIQKLRSDILEVRQNVASESDENKKDSEQKHAEVLKRLQSIEELVSKVQSDVVKETKDVDVPPTVSISLSSNNAPAKAPEIGKSFVLKHVFKDVETFEHGDQNHSEDEEHFGVKWSICLIRRYSNLEFFLFLAHPEENWKIDTTSDLKIIGPKETEFTRTMEYCFEDDTGYGFPKFVEWDKMKNYLIDGSLTTEIHVKIKETKGLRKEKFRSFRGSDEVSDIVLVVKDTKFNVLKPFLAAQSSFFKALLLGNFSESKQSEVTLTGIDPEDFHFFLEVLYGEAAIDETNVEGIALLADMYAAPTAIRRCEEFMLEKSKKTLKRKLQMADQYHLRQLKKKCLSEIKTLSDVRNVVPEDIHDLEHSTMAALLVKAISVEQF